MANVAPKIKGRANAPVNSKDSVLWPMCESSGSSFHKNLDDIQKRFKEYTYYPYF